MSDIFRVKTTDMRTDKIYGGVLVGDIQKDESGKIWWRRAGGEIQEISPRPEALWVEKGSAKDRGFLRPKPKLTIVE